MHKKEPRDMLIECLSKVKTDIEKAIGISQNKPSVNTKEMAEPLWLAKGRIEDFLTILKYLDNQ